MDKSLDQRSAANSQLKTEFLGNLLLIYRNIKGWLIYWFVLTEEQKIAASVYLGPHGRRK